MKQFNINILFRTFVYLYMLFLPQTNHYQFAPSYGGTAIRMNGIVDGSIATNSIENKLTNDRYIK